jgi:hypothetical protein
MGTDADEKQEAMNLRFLTPEIIEKDKFNKINLEGANNRIFNSGKPMLPVYTKMMVLPFGAKINDIRCDVGNVETMVLKDKITPAPEPQIKSMVTVSTEVTMDETIYSSKTLFPNDWYNYHTGVGLDENMEHKTLVTVNVYPVRYSPGTDTVYYAQNINLKITYDDPGYNPFPTNAEYDMVIIAPSSFETDLQPLIDHKKSFGIDTVLKTTEDILKDYSGFDEPEKIKYFIKDALETWGVKYVLIVGGLKSWIYARPRDDDNQGTSKWWHVPVRYSNLYEGEPGYCCDLYFADVYKDGGVFDDWDSNDDGIIAYMRGGSFNNDELDLFPDVAIGRLACRNTREVQIIVDKIITYETTADASWFKKMIVVSGDGFLDQFDLDVQWDTKSLPDGEYTIYAQSENPDGKKGPIDEIPITLDRTVETNLTFNHDDHLTTGLKYPHDPVAEIVSVSDGDILGNTDYRYVPTGGQAYLNSNLHWADIEYQNGVLHIRGKTYDPQPYGYSTDLKVWIKNSAGDTVFEDERLDSRTYFEGEWTTGEELLHGRAGGPYYMPNDFDKEFLWTSNGKWTDQSQVISEFNKGAGFVFFSGHGSPGWWGNHFPGIPGNRHKGETEGLLVFDFSGSPYLPMNKLTNDYKNPVVVVGGCHNSDFNVSLIPSIIDKRNALWTHCYGRPTPECWAWYLTSLSKRGAIACMGNTGYGYGILNEWCTSGGVDNWITTEFFKQYGTEGYEILGEAYAQTLTSYINVFRTIGDPESPWDSIHEKTVQQWILHGDPSLILGGYAESPELIIKISGFDSDVDGRPNNPVKIEALSENQPVSYTWDLDDDGNYGDATGESIEEQWAEPGVYRVSVKATYGDREIIQNTIVEIEKDRTPEKPSIPNGESNIKRGHINVYTASANDPYNDELYYLFDWGDEKYSIIGPLDSGETAIASHGWTNKGTYNVKVQAFDSFGQWSDWSDSLEITVTQGKAKTHTLLQDFLYNIFEKYPNVLPILRQLLGL